MDYEYTADIEDILSSPAFKACMQAMEHLGPFSSDPKIDRAYRALRLTGLSQEDTIDLINN